MKYYPGQVEVLRKQARVDAIFIVALGLALIVGGFMVLALLSSQPQLAAYGCNPDNGEGVLYAHHVEDFPETCSYVVAL